MLDDDDDVMKSMMRITMLLDSGMSDLQEHGFALFLY